MSGPPPDGTQPAGASRRAFGTRPRSRLVVVASALISALFAAVRLTRHAAERRRTEDALSSSRDQLETILQGVADAITVQDPDGRIVYANDAAARLVGHSTAAELLAAPRTPFVERYEVLDIDGRPIPREQLPGRRALAGELVGETVVRFRLRESGEERWSAVKATPIFDASGKVQFAVNIFSDISERRREDERRRFLTDAGAALASSLDYTETLGRLAHLAVPALADFCVVFALEDGQIRRLQAIHGDPAKQPLLDELRRFSIDRDSGAPIARVLRSGIAELTASVEDTDVRGISGDSDHHAALSALAPRSMITAPLVARGSVFGGISMVMAESGRRYGPDDLTLVEDLARRASVAVDSARLFAEARAAQEQAHQRAEQLSLLAAAARVFAGASPHYPDVLDVIAREVTRTTGDGCIIRLLSEPSRALTPVAVSHPNPEAEKLARSIVVEEAGGAVGRLPREVQEHGVPLLLHAGEGLEGAITPTFLPYVERFGVQSLLVLPLMAQNRVIGVMSVSRERPRPPLTADDARFLDDLAGRAALAIDNALLYAAEARARERAEATAGRITRLQAVTAALAEALTPDQVAEVVVQQGRATLGAHAGGIVLLTPDGAHLEILTAFGYPDNILEQYRRYPVTDPLPAGEAVRSRRPVWLMSRTQIVEQSPRLRPVAEQIDSNAIAALPLIAGPRVIGAMLLSFDREGAISEDDQAFLLALARQCAQALERARLFVAEHDARAEAEAANNAKDEFLSTLSHELRTPLTSMLGWSRLLRSRRLDPSAVAEGLETIERNARQQAGLIEDLLDVSRIITGKLRLDIEPVDLPALLYSAVESARPAAEARRVAVSFSAAAGVTMVEGDSARLRQVFDNLLSNAIKFTPEDGEVEVHLAPEGRDACVTVRDTGAGIAPEFLPHIFERFRQADASSTRVYGGLGLGLSIVKYIVDQHAGSIRVVSEGEGKGATFTVSLPVRGSALDVDVRGMLQHGSEGDGTLLAGVLVLVVEDDADTRNVLTATLAGYGAEVITAGSTPEARNLLARERPDVILSDIAMPGDDGYALIAAVRGMKGETARVPAIAVTAYAGTEHRDRLLAAGFDLYVAKPVEPADLVAAVARLAGRVGHV
jgi:PAS domain S-box-containing protein